MFELLTHNVLFELFPFTSQRHVIDDDHLLQLSEVVEPLPVDMLAKWFRHSLYYGLDRNRLITGPFEFDESPFGQAMRKKSERKAGPPAPLPSLEDEFYECKSSDINATEAAKITTLLRDVLRIDLTHGSEQMH
jgi:hypothetical protein